MVISHILKNYINEQDITLIKIDAFIIIMNTK
jgi:hypothetical protein